MRFDGYFLLSDLWGVDNLQGRAFALCRWRLREALFGYGDPMPEPWPPGLRRRLLVWGYGSWLWRAALFLGIALTVYHLFFKVLGLFLMLVELLWFIGLPIWNEAWEWWKRRDQAHPGRLLLTAGGLSLLVAVLCVPWRASVEIPAMVEASRVTTLHAPLAARLKTIHARDGQRVEAGQLLLELESPDLDARQRIVRREVEILQLQLRRQAGRSETVGDVGILEQQLAEAVAEYRGLAAQRERLQIRAPQAGTLRDLLPELAPGRWLSPSAVLARVVEPGVRARGYLAEQALWRVEPGDSGRFIADDPNRPALPVRLVSIDATGATHLDLEALASDQHGPIAAQRDAEGRAQPLQAQYGVRLDVQGELSPLSQPLRGEVVLKARGESLLGAAWRRVAALGIRESGF
ncbi:efflux transporter, RND family, MFP subunit [compost metagenome]